MFIFTYVISSGIILYMPFPPPLSFEISLLAPSTIILSFRLYNLATSKSEVKLFGQRKGCFKYEYVVSALQLSLDFLFSCLFVFGWLIRSLVRSSVQTSRIFLHGCCSLSSLFLRKPSRSKLPESNKTDTLMVILILG